MATGLEKLRLCQLGFESTRGTAVAATAKVVGKAGFKPKTDWDHEDFPRGVRVPVDEYLAVMRSTELTVETDLDYEQCLWPLQTGLDAASPSGTGPYVYAHELQTTPTVKACTAEFVITDGTTKHYEREAAFMTTKQFEISIVRNQPAKLSWDMFGRAEQASTVTAALTPIAGRARIPSNLFALYIDDTWANLGTTQKTGTLLEATLTVPTGIGPDVSLDARPDLDMVTTLLDEAKPTLKLKARHNANMATEVGNWRTGTLRFIRLIADNGAAGADQRTFQIDLCARLVSFDMGEDAGQSMVDADWEIVYDETSTHALIITTTNGLSALP